MRPVSEPPSSPAVWPSPPLPAAPPPAELPGAEPALPPLGGDSGAGASSSWVAEARVPEAEAEPELRPFVEPERLLVDPERCVIRGPD